MRLRQQPIRAKSATWQSIALLTILAAAVLCAASVRAQNTPVRHAALRGRYMVYVGTYTGPQSKGIYDYRFDTSSGKFTALGVAAEVANPSFLVTDPHHRFLYAVSEMANGPHAGYRTDGFISSFAIDPKTGSLKLLNKVDSGGGGPCHLVVDRTGRMLFVANYGSGNVASFAIRPDGSIGERTGFDQHQGSSVNPQRQKGPHAHSVVLSPDNRFLFVPDLGLDKIFIYRVDAAKRTFTPNDPAYAQVDAGLGPRHFTFGPGAKFAYAVCEMGSRVVAFAYNRATGSLKTLQTISTLPAGFSGENASAEIQVDSSGRFLYASNRGNDSITVFRIDPVKGTLTKVQVEPGSGKMPRNFVIDPTGKFLIVANQKSDQMVVFAIDRASGELKPTGETVDVPAPVCILFVPGQ